jgi:hypothetical protein
MKHINIPLVQSVNYDFSIKDVSILLDTLPKHYIDNELWSEFKSNCETSFSMAHCGSAILLKYYVNEDVIKSTMFKTNDPVHRDNCVEFFISFGAEKEYYNIEMNCLGICLMGYGIDRANREILPEAIINKIRRGVLIKSAEEPAGTKFEWQITLVVPIEVFTYTKLTSFEQEKGSCNFFKCGDDLPEPHFFSWNKIYNQKPDFHLPEFFGNIQFM